MGEIIVRKGFLGFGQKRIKVSDSMCSMDIPDLPGSESEKIGRIKIKDGIFQGLAVTPLGLFTIVGRIGEYIQDATDAAIPDKMPSEKIDLTESHRPSLVTRRSIIRRIIGQQQTV